MQYSSIALDGFNIEADKFYGNLRDIRLNANLLPTLIRDTFSDTFNTALMNVELSFGEEKLINSYFLQSYLKSICSGPKIALDSSITQENPNLFNNAQKPLSDISNLQKQLAEKKNSKSFTETFSSTTKLSNTFKSIGIPHQNSLCVPNKPKINKYHKKQQSTSSTAKPTILTQTMIVPNNNCNNNSGNDDNNNTSMSLRNQLQTKQRNKSASGDAKTSKPQFLVSAWLKKNGNNDLNQTKNSTLTSIKISDHLNKLNN